ncbi:methyl-accepting chemotaxis protein [Anaerobiospirillum sp. NML120449]|uniref:methyl-accepting chemotaxis protein n=1 Tax=Anaerobiospirillum sp. NML120449 TaxID=2932817 RepID=UPI001FF4DDC4|nr:methyl-accepting chemotaxis protein [Anaerobiospirillum sp. NML120449]MCK0527392.1 methyl-accepting chemotaxis protein [Anaerobiospirillum sp. NML120449]
MSFFASSSIKTKLLSCFVIILILSCLVSGLSIKAMYSSINIATDLQDKISVGFRRVTAVSNALENSNEYMVSYLTPNNQSDSNRARLESSIEELNRAVAGLHADDEIRVAVDQIRAQTSKYIQHYNNDVVSLIKAHRPYEALEVYLNVIAPLTSEMKENITKITAVRFGYIETQSADLIQTTSLMFVIGLTFVQIILSIVIAISIASSIQRSIKVQCDAAQALSNGDFTYHFPPSSQDEFGVLNNAMVSMATKLRETISHVVTLSNEINESMKSVEEASSNICDAMSRTESQAITVAASADEMVATTSNIAKNCVEAAKSSQDSSELTHQGMDSVNESASSIMSQYEQMKHNATTIQSLVDQAQKIGSIVGTIDEIAAQTNLLALNAAIEAARAGEAGRGFAVVADEVRALATRTTSSTQEIRGMVDRIQAETTHATEAMQANLDNMSEVASNTSHVQETLSNALNYVNEVNAQITQIATAAEQQTSATSEISNNMQNITHASAEVSRVAQDARHISVSTSERLHDLIHNLKFFKI